MKIRALFAAVMICLGFPAAADFTTVQQAYEVRLSTFNVPVTHNGIITFDACPECESVSARITGNTQFLVNGNAVELKEFRKQVFQISDRANTALTVVHHLGLGTITSISVSL